MIEEINKIIELYKLEKHPEGGYFKETYRSNSCFNFENNHPTFKSNRNFSTQIIFLVHFENVSKLHKIKSDEIWHFYRGAPFRLYIFDNNLNLETITLNNLDFENPFQYTVKSGYWFCGETTNINSYSLMGCSVSPGFEFEDLQFPDNETKLAILSKYGYDFNKFF